MKAPSRSTLPAVTPVIARRVAPRLALLLVLALLLCLAALVAGAYATTVTFTAEELLGKPTDTSVTINIVPASNIQYHYEYGTASGAYTHQTAPVTATGGQPSEVTIGGLSPDTLYYYRMVYTNVADGTIETRSEHTFRTQRKPIALGGDPFAFTSRRTRTGRGQSFGNTMTNILNEQPDFDVDMGDTFMIDNTTSQSGRQHRLPELPEAALLRQDRLLHPDLPVLGQPRERRGLELRRHAVQHRAREHQGPQALLPDAHQRRLLQRQHGSAGGPRRGDLRRPASRGLLRLDLGRRAVRGHRPVPVHDEPALRAGAAGEGTDDPPNGDQWSWTLGQQQYDWLTQTLENSHAKYKFVFSHQMVGGIRT